MLSISFGRLWIILWECLGSFRLIKSNNLESHVSDNMRRFVWLYKAEYCEQKVDVEE